MKVNYYCQIDIDDKNLAKEKKKKMFYTKFTNYIIYTAAATNLMTNVKLMTKINE